MPRTSIVVLETDPTPCLGLISEPGKIERNNMTIKRYTLIAGLFALIPLAACEEGNDTRVTPPTTNNSTDADNTANNEGDGSQSKRTPVDQSESGDSIRITAEIRRAIMNDDSMSMNAQNCKVITDSAGVVTLRGVVNSQAEKDSVDAKARSVAGVTRVDNQLEVNTN